MAGDLNGDHKLDLAVTNSVSNDIPILLGNGDGTFQRTTYPTGNGSRALVAADFDRDGNLDLAVANYYSYSVSILRGNGDGTFRRRRLFSAGCIRKLWLLRISTGMESRNWWRQSRRSSIQARCTWAKT